MNMSLTLRQHKYDKTYFWTIGEPSYPNPNGMNGKLSWPRVRCCVCVHFILFDARRNPLRYSGGGICLRFAVFGYFLRGYLRFRGFWALFLRFCGFGKTAAVCGFWPYLHAVLRFQVILFAVLRYQCILLCDFIDLTITFIYDYVGQE